MQATDTDRQTARHDRKTGIPNRKSAYDQQTAVFNRGATGSHPESAVVHRERRRRTGRSDQTRPIDRESASDRHSIGRDRNPAGDDSQSTFSDGGSAAGNHETVLNRKTATDHHHPRGRDSQSASGKKKTAVSQDELAIDRKTASTEKQTDVLDSEAARNGQAAGMNGHSSLGGEESQSSRLNSQSAAFHCNSRLENSQSASDGQAAALNGNSAADGNNEFIGNRAFESDSSGLDNQTIVADGVGLLGFGGMKITDGGASFPAGLSIVAAGLAAESVQVSDLGLLIKSGLSVKSAGLSTEGGMTVTSSGVVTPSVVVRDGGFSLNDGLSIQSGGLAASSLTVHSAGMIVATGRLEVADIGLAVSHLTGSIRIRKDGFSSEDLVAVRNNGLGITGGVSVRSAGVKVTGGLTIDSGRVSAGGVQVATNGVKVFGGNLFAVNDGGAFFEEDLKVYGGTAFQYYSLGPSDQRLKRNIVSIPKSLEIVRQIRGIEYTTLEDPFTRRFGVIAQEVERVLPSLVTPFRLSARKVAQLSVVDQNNKDNNNNNNNNQEEELGTKEGKMFKSVDYLSLVPVLLNSIADLLLSREKSVAHNKKNCSFSSLSDSSLLFMNSKNGTVAIDNNDENEENDEKNSNQWSGEFSCGCYRKYQNKIEELFSELETLQNERKSLQAELMEHMKAGQFV
jgi:hypothetical protein